MTAKSSPPIPGRCLLDHPQDGALNMGLDEALLRCRKLPTLRFYRWKKPTLSLGYFQTTKDLPLAEIQKRGYDLVRRSTGGKAILHQDELTYSLCAPEHGALAGGPAQAMKTIHQALAAALARQAKQAIELRQSQTLLSDQTGSAWCFEDSSPLDITMGARKLLGSAARRQAGWILFHGSLVLTQPSLTPHIAALGFEPDCAALTAALGQALNLVFTAGSWSAEEFALGEKIAQEKYASHEFTWKR